MRAHPIGDTAVYLVPWAARPLHRCWKDELLSRPDWNGRENVLKYSITSKAAGEKVFARETSPGRHHGRA